MKIWLNFRAWLALCLIDSAVKVAPTGDINAETICASLIHTHSYRRYEGYTKAQGVDPLPFSSWLPIAQKWGLL